MTAFSTSAQIKFNANGQIGTAFIINSFIWQVEPDGELEKIEGDNIYTQFPVYRDAEGNHYSERISVRFNERVAKYDIQTQRRNDVNFIDPAFNGMVEQLEGIVYDHS